MITCQFSAVHGKPIGTVRLVEDFHILRRELARNVVVLDADDVIPFNAWDGMLDLRPFTLV